MAKITDKEIIKQIQDLANMLGRTPTRKEFNEDPDTVSATCVEYHLGSWNDALRLAGLEINNTHNVREASHKRLIDRKTTAKTTHVIPRSDFKRRYSDEELFAQVRNLTEEKGRIPTAKEFAKDSRTVSYMTINKYYGSWLNYLSAAGIDPTYPIYSDEDLISQYWMLEEEYGRAPLSKEFNNDPRTACLYTIRYHFGSWGEFCEAAEKGKH